VGRRKINHNNKINYTDYGQQRAIERGISEKDIYDALNNPLKIEDIKINKLRDYQV